MPRTVPPARSARMVGSGEGLSPKHLSNMASPSAERPRNFSAPYRARRCRALGPRPSRQPGEPFAGNDADHVGQVFLALAAALLHGDEPEARGFADRVLDQPAAGPGSRRDLVVRAAAGALPFH